LNFACEHSILSTEEIMVSIHYVNSVKGDELWTSHETTILGLVKHISGLSIKTFQIVIQCISILQGCCT